MQKSRESWKQTERGCMLGSRSAAASPTGNRPVVADCALGLLRHSLCSQPVPTYPPTCTQTYICASLAPGHPPREPASQPASRLPTFPTAGRLGWVLVSVWQAGWLTLPSRLLRTAQKMMTSFSWPWKPSTDSTLAVRSSLGSLQKWWRCQKSTEPFSSGLRGEGDERRQGDRKRGQDVRGR